MLLVVLPNRNSSFFDIPLLPNMTVQAPSRLISSIKLPEMDE
jgi:hypothetical protein